MTPLILFAFIFSLVARRSRRLHDA
jgi:hypothetical protein